MLHTIEQINTAVNNFIWGLPAMICIIGWGLYGSRCVEFLFRSKAIRPFLVIYSFVSIVGVTMDLGLLWDISDTFNGLMAIPNLIALFLLSGVVVKLVRERIEHV